MDYRSDESKIINIPGLNYEPDPKGVGYVYYHSMTKNKDKVAQIDGLNGEKDTFESLLRRCVRVAIKMRSMGVQKSDIISTCSFNHMNSCVPHISTMFLGARSASFDPSLSTSDMKHLINLVKPKLLFVTPESVDLLTEIIKELKLDSTQIIVFGGSGRDLSFNDFLDQITKEEEDSFLPFEVDDLGRDSVIMFSSGTTGLPKGLRLSHRHLLKQAMNIYELEHIERLLSFATLYWASSTLFCASSLVNGFSRIIVPKFDLNSLWSTIRTYKPTLMFVSPYLCLSIMYDSNENLSADCLKTIVISGGPLSKIQMTNLKQKFPHQRIFLSYGLSEAGFVTYFRSKNIDKHNYPDFLDEKPTSSGFGIFGTSYKVVDLGTENPLGPYEKGEIRLKNDYMLTGYYNLDSSGIFDSDGYLKTGDVGYYDEDHYFYVVNRLKEMMKYQSFHVLPASIEAVILTHPNVKQAVVIGVPHEIDGQHPMALVVLRNKDVGVTEQELITFVNEKVSDREQLRGGLKIVQDFPLTPTGKIDRKTVESIIFNSNCI